MRRLFRWIAGLVSVAALAKLLSGRRRGHAAPQSAPDVPLEPDPADELRRKLAEVRASAPADEPAPPVEPAAAAPQEADTAEAAETGGAAADEAPAPSIEERRAAIHARAQEAIDAMKEIAP